MGKTQAVRYAGAATLLLRHMITGLVLRACIALAPPSSAHELTPIPRSLPPTGRAPAAAERDALQMRLEQMQARLAALGDTPLAPDVDVYLQAVRLALRYDEFYRDGDLDRAYAMLKSAEIRVLELTGAQASWTTARGCVVRGYRSQVDGSTQPYGLVIPQHLDLTRPVPLYVWLHGRGDETTNLAFLHERETQTGQIAPNNAIVVHPFGRHCVGFKSAGEVDVMETIDHVATQYAVDRRRIVLMGFSMGGAGCWHLGAHYTDRWVAISPGAGFAETAGYQRLRAEDVPWFEQRLWGNYDVPAYVRNLLNVPVIAYSGEHDKQIQAAQVMAQAFAEHGHQLDHRVGPGMAHKYHPDTLAEILRVLDHHVQSGQPPRPPRVTLQTQTLRYHRMHWVEMLGMERHWQDARIDAAQLRDDHLELATRNVTALRIDLGARAGDAVEINADGDLLQVKLNVDSRTERNRVTLRKADGHWQHDDSDEDGLTKRPGLQGPIDDAFLDPFLVVLPSGVCRHPRVQRWVVFEQARFLDRWQAVFRGVPRVKLDRDVTAEDAQQYHLILWGDPAANQVLRRLAERLPIAWTESAILARERQYGAPDHALIMVYPNPESPRRYVVLNSGPTFREGHDRTNSLQNPKLPDWAVIDLSEPPTALAPGRIAEADFFSETWQLEPPQR